MIAAARSPRGRSLLLWAGLAVGPLVWTLHELVLYPLTSQACFPGVAGVEAGAWVSVVVGVGTVAAAVAAAAGLQAALRAGRRAEDDTAEVRTEAVRERERFMSRAGVLLSVLFLYAVLMAGLPALLVSPCG